MIPRILRPSRIPKTGRLRATAALLTGLLTATPLLPSPGWAQDGTWTASCGGADVSLFGGNLHGQASATIAVPGGRDADSIVVEVIGKGHSVPGACTVSGKGAAGSMPKSVDLMPVGLGSQSAVRFRSRVEPTDAVYVSTDNPEGSAAVVVYAFFSGSEQVASGEYSAYYLYHGSWESSLPLAPATDLRDVDVLVPVAGLAGEERVAIVQAEAGGVRGMASVYGQREDHFQLMRIRLQGVPATAQSVQLRVFSPESDEGLGQGGSFTFGTVVRSACHADLAVACGSERSVDVVQKRLRAGEDQTVFINDPASIERLEVEAWMPDAGRTASVSFSPLNAPVQHVLQERAATDHGPMVFRTSLPPTRAFQVESDHPGQDLYVTVLVHRKKAGAGRALAYGKAFQNTATMHLRVPAGTDPLTSVLRVPVLADAPLRVDVEIGGKRFTDRWVPKSAAMQAGMLTLPLLDMDLKAEDFEDGRMQITVQAEKAGARGIASAMLEFDCAQVVVCAPPAQPRLMPGSEGALQIDWSDAPDSRRFRICVEQDGRNPDCQSTGRTQLHWTPDADAGAVTLKLQRQCADGQASEPTVLTVDAEQLTRMAAESSDQELDLMPNPAQSFTVLRRSRADLDATVAVRDLQGRVHQEVVFASGETQLRLDLSPLAPGTYLVELREGERQTVRRLIRTE